MQLASSMDTYDLYTTSPRHRWGDNELLRVYGYSDRALYRAGDTLSYAGFVREM